MQAYARTERSATGQCVRVLDPTAAPLRQGFEGGDSEAPLLDHLLGRLAELVADRLMERTTAAPTHEASEWLDARGAAEYLGIHRDTVRKLAAQRAIPAHQDGPRCRLYFRRDELHAWRCSTRPTTMRAARLRAV